MSKKQTVYLGSDMDSHALKQLFKDFLKEKDIPFVDLGVFENDTTGFDKIKSELVEKVLQEENPQGVLMFGKNSTI